MIVSCHIPRAAGTTFLGILQQLFVVDVQDFQPIREVAPGVNCIHGHFPSNKYNHIYPQAKKVTWIREPIDRLISNYTLDKQAVWPTDNLHILRLRAGEVDFLEYASWAPNGLCSYLVEPVEAYSFIGVVEYWDICLERFFRRFAQGRSVDYIEYNVLARPFQKEIRESLGAKDLKQLRKQNERDYQLYERIKKRWQARRYSENTRT